MLTETIELDLANSGLAGLDELSFLRIFATTQARAIVHGTGRTLRQIENADGVPLYPAFYRTRLVVPPPVLFNHYTVWDRIVVGVEVERFGRMLLESKGALGPPGSLAVDAASWDRSRLIHVEGSMAFVRDQRTDDAAVDAPRDGTIAALPAMARRPTALDDQRRIRSEGIVLAAPPGVRLLTAKSRQKIMLARDVQAGRALMFAGFTSLLEVGEQRLLAEQLWPPLAPALFSHAQVLEREVHYLDNVHQGDTVSIDMVGTLSGCPSELANAYPSAVGVALLELRSEIYHEGTNRLLAAARTRKIMVVPRTRATDIQDIQRIVRKHGSLA